MEGALLVVHTEQLSDNINSTVIIVPPAVPSDGYTTKKITWTGNVGTGVICRVCKLIKDPCNPAYEILSVVTDEDWHFPDIYVASQRLTVSVAYDTKLTHCVFSFRVGHRS